MRKSKVGWLLSTTAVVSVCLVSSPAWSVDQTVSGTVTAAKTVNGGDTLTVQSGAKLSTSSGTISVTGGSAGAVTITNTGTIEQTGSARAIRNQNASLTINLNNAQGASITSVGDDVMKTNGGYRINNQGTIWQKGTGTGSGQALDLRDATAAGNTLVNGSATNTTATIRADGDDALRPGANTVITNYGIIISNGVVNTKCPDYLGAACNGKPSAHDGIDVGGSLNVVVNNYGTISGPRHGITADNDITVTNYAGGVIVGRNGSGVGSDGNGRVINYGTIRGDYAGAGNAYNHTNGLTINNGDGDGVDIDKVAYIENYGQILGSGAGGVDSGNRANGADGIAAGGGFILNAASGLVRGAKNGILIDDGAGGSGVGATQIVNRGIIECTTGYGIRIEGAFDNTIDNAGRISGGTDAIHLGSGNDTLTLRQGSILKGGIDLGGGQNTLNYLAGGNAVLSFTGAAPQIVTTTGGAVVRSGSTVAIVNTVGQAAAPGTVASLTTGISDMVFGRMAASGFTANAGAAGDLPPMMNLGMGEKHASARSDGQPSDVSNRVIGWGNAFGSWTRTDASSSGDGAFSRVGGFAAGYDWSAGRGLRIGAFAGGATGDTKVGSGTETSEQDSIFGGLYAQQAFSGYSIDAALALGATRIDRDRRVMSNVAASGVSTLSAEYWSHFVNPTIGITTRGGFLGTPLLASARVGYAGSFDQSYTETGGAGALSFDTHALHLFHANAEAGLPLTVTASNGVAYVFAPVVGVRGYTQVGNTQIDGSILGTDFAVSPGGDRTVGTAYAGFKASVALGANGVAFADFEAGHRSDDTDEIKAKAGVKFAW